MMAVALERMEAALRKLDAKRTEAVRDRAPVSVIDYYSRQCDQLRVWIEKEKTKEEPKWRECR